VKGDLKDFRLHDLVQICCQHTDDVRLALSRGDTVGTVFFSGAAIVHAESLRGIGKAALFDLLGWESGAFDLEKDAPPPVRSIDQPWTSLLEEAEELLAVSREHLERSDPSISRPVPGAGASGVLPAGEVLSPSDEIVRRLRGIRGVQASILAGANGEVLAHAGDGDPERLAAVAAFVGEAAASIGQPLSLGALRRGIVVMAGHRVVVTGFGSEFAGLRIADEAAVDQVCGEARSLLGWS
jgi:predicted regulator of Ras-like GTPase activity (Roadblock/LC7/MglB family)